QFAVACSAARVPRPGDRAISVSALVAGSRAQCASTMGHLRGRRRRADTRAVSPCDSTDWSGERAPVPERVLGFRHPVVRYAFAVPVTVLVTVAALAAYPVIDLLPSPPFLLAVLVVAWVAGFGPALLTCAVSLAVIHYVFLAPLRWMDPRQLLSLPTF